MDAVLAAGAVLMIFRILPGALEGDMLDILMGGKHTVVKVTSVQEFTTKAAAAEMYEMITRGDLE